MKTKLAIAMTWLTMFSACKATVQDMEGELVMNPVRESGYRELEVWDETAKRTQMLPAGRYRLSMKGKASLAISDGQGQAVATMSLKEAKFRDGNNRFFMSLHETKQPLDVYGGRRKNVLHRQRVGKPDQLCTIHCCTTHQDCTTTTDSNGRTTTTCHTVCDDCTGHQDELWEKNTFRYDYEIFFGKPGDYEVGSFIAKGHVQTEDVMVDSESCH